jgi:hypothetical protein
MAEDTVVLTSVVAAPVRQPSSAAMEASDASAFDVGSETVAPDLLHEDSARKQRVRSKRADDSAFKA